MRAVLTFAAIVFAVLSLLLMALIISGNATEGSVGEDYGALGATFASLGILGINGLIAFASFGVLSVADESSRQNTILTTVSISLSVLAALLAAWQIWLRN